MANGYSLPPWLIPQRAPWEALIAGVQAGSQIAANRQRGRALAAQMGHRAFQETAMQKKFEADAQDLATLQQWWPAFAGAEGEALKTLQVPPLKNAQMWNRITLEVERKKQQAAASEFANIMSGVDLATPEGQATIWNAAAKNPQIQLDLVGERIERAVTARRLQQSAEETARHNLAMEENALIRMVGQEFTPEVQTIDGERIIRLGQNRWQYLGKDVDTEELKPTLRLSIYKAQIQEAQKALADIGTDSPDYAKWSGRLERAIQNRDAMLKGGKPEPEAEGDAIMFDKQNNKVRVPRARMGEFLGKGYQMVP